MKEISSFFDKFKNIALKEISKREAICSSIEKITKLKVEIKDISIRDGVVSLKGGSLLKSEVFLKKKQILDLIAKKTNTKIVDIR